jgi:hypothetical protein
MTAWARAPPGRRLFRHCDRWSRGIRKGTVAAGVAQALRFNLLDSGSLYRLGCAESVGSERVAGRCGAARRVAEAWKSISRRGES